MKSQYEAKVLLQGEKLLVRLKSEKENIAKKEVNALTRQVFFNISTDEMPLLGGKRWFSHRVSKSRSCCWVRLKGQELKEIILVLDPWKGPLQVLGIGSYKLSQGEKKWKKSSDHAVTTTSTQPPILLLSTIPVRIISLLSCFCETSCWLGRIGERKAISFKGERGFQRDSIEKRRE